MSKGNRKEQSRRYRERRKTLGLSSLRGKLKITDLTAEEQRKFVDQVIALLAKRAKQNMTWPSTLEEWRKHAENS